MSAYIYVPGFLAQPDKENEIIGGFDGFHETCMGIQRDFVMSGEHYTLKWETKYLVAMGAQMNDWLAQSAVSTAAWYNRRHHHSCILFLVTLALVLGKLAPPPRLGLPSWLPSCGPRL